LLGDAILLTTEDSIFYVVRIAIVAMQRRGKHASTTIEKRQDRISLRQLRLTEPAQSRIPDFGVTSE
jgi:hypothetical protein